MTPAMLGALVEGEGELLGSKPSAPVRQLSQAEWIQRVTAPDGS